MSSSFRAGIICEACKMQVVPLDRALCVQDSCGCHLVCELESLSVGVKQHRPHPDTSVMPFKVGKLFCSCSGELGNIQNNIHQGECALLKFATVRFAITPTELIPELKGTVLGKAVGFLVPGKGGKGGGRGALGRGRATFSSPPECRLIKVEHLRRAAASMDDLRQAQHRRPIASETREQPTPTPVALKLAISGSNGAGTVKNEAGSSAMHATLQPVIQDAAHSDVTHISAKGLGRSISTAAASPNTTVLTLAPPARNSSVHPVAAKLPSGEMSFPSGETVLNSLGLPLRPDAEKCSHFLKHGTCGYGVSCVKHHPEPERGSSTVVGVVGNIRMDKNGNDIAFVDLRTESSEKLDKDKQKAFLFLGTTSDGFKPGGSAIMSGGLPLICGDQLADLELTRSDKGGLQIGAGFLANVASSGRSETNFRQYLEGLLAALLGEASARETALHSMSHRRACRAVWNQIAMYRGLNSLIVRVIEALVETSANGSTSRRFARSALEGILLSSVTLPPATVYELMSGAPAHVKMRGQLVRALLKVWRVAPYAQRRIHFLLRTLCGAHRNEALSLLGVEEMLDMMSTSLPGGDVLSCYGWRELPLKLLPSESSGEPGGEAILRRVLAKGGSYETFDAYMECYVGLLREDCFSGMRKGLKALRCGSLDAREMRVFTGVRLVAMSPPNVFGGAEGTVLELRGRYEGFAREMMFGSLVALAPRGKFDTDELVWATVAGSDIMSKESEFKQRELRIFVELGPTMNEDDDAELVSLLLRHSGAIVIVESPTFYRAYAPAIVVLQAMVPDDLPFADQIIHGRQEEVRLLYPETTIDASIVFNAAKGSQGALPQCMDMQRFMNALTWLKGTEKKVTRTGLCTTLDRSQSEALHTALTSRFTIIQGPPGTGKSFTIVSLLRLLDSISSRPIDEAGPTLVLTYKNRSLEDILSGCMQFWPDGVARCGGSARPGSLLEHRHIKSLLRSSNTKCKELEEAKANARTQRDRVQAAARALAGARSFSAATLCSAEFEPQLRKLLTHAPSTSEEEQRKFAELLAERGSSANGQSQLLSQVSGTINLWLPSKEKCASLCPSRGGQNNAKQFKQDSTPSGQREEEAADRNQYRSFEEAAVHFEDAASTGALQQREVLELLDPPSDSEVLRLLQEENPWDLSLVRRVSLMNAMVRRTYMKAEQAYNEAMVAYNETLAKLRHHDIEQQISLLCGMKVVGLTISGAAIYRDTIAALRAPHVLVEEAGEVLEPLTIAALGPWVKRLTLVGDHLQLPPSVESHELAKQYAFNTSLMGRMVHNKVRSVTLSAQSRMMPEMADLLRDIYPEYRTSDLVDVANRSSPPAGALHSMWWWNVHAAAEGGESIDPGARSFVNECEATAAAALVKHFVRSGISPSHISVLASYSAQVKLIERYTNNALKDVHDSSWPVSHVHGLAARQLLSSIKAENPKPRARQARVQQCMSISETFLKLCQIEDALSALRHAKKLADGPELTAIHEIEERVEKLKHTASDVIDNCTLIKGSDDTRGIIASAIDALKRLEDHAVRFRTMGSAGVPAAASACLLTQLLAKNIEDTGKCSEGVKRLLHSMCLGAQKHVQELQTLERVTFSSIDRYQGSENDVVIVSLVRSNEDCDLGFLSERARRVVAQSRARMGMYFVADSVTFSSNKHWNILIGKMRSCERVGTTIPLVCPAHRSRGATVVACKDAAQFMERGICNEACAQLMACGKHRCKRRCHGSGSGVDELHMICHESVPDVCCAAEKHLMTRKCFQQPADVFCKACDELERSRKEKEKRDMEEREKEAQIELEAQINELKKAPPTLHKNELRCEGPTVAEFLRVVDRTEKYVQADHMNPIAVVRIEKLSHPLLEKKFFQAKMKLCSPLNECLTLDLFHGTSKEGVEGITNNGFRLPEWSNKNMFGRGVYFATDSSKSANPIYTKQSNCLLLCDVALGRSCTVNGLTSNHELLKYVRYADKDRPFLDIDGDKLKKAGFDSVLAPRGSSMEKGGVKFDEYIVYDPNQALPRYIVHYASGGGNIRLNSRLATSNITGIARFELKPSRSFDEKDPLQLHFRIVESQVLRMLRGRIVTLAKVEYIENTCLMNRFEAQRKKFESKGISTEMILSFHGTTSRQAVENIVKNNFNMARLASNTGDKGWYGAGFYFSDFPQTSMTYGGGTHMLMCRLLPGKVTDVLEKCEGAPIRGNSHRTGRNADGYGQELVIDNPDQILPCYILHFEGSVGQK